MSYDVAVIGGGPGGATVGTLLKKYCHSLSVVILERESFPRDHVGESQLPGVSSILNEMGCWEKVEAANFPIKLGGTYRWGKNPELWDVEFFPGAKFQSESRPAKYEGQRRATAFQVDRAIYDKILLDHARETGCEVREETRVVCVNRSGDAISSLTLGNDSEITARYYIDASGHSGIVRRAMGVEVDCPTSLKNIAIWDYWQNADWAVEIGVGGTYIQVLSVGYGWIWFIPLGPTRTSIGLVVPANYFSKAGKTPLELYTQAINSDEHLAKLMTNARAEQKLSTTKDWSFNSSRHCGENWFLVGEAGGFADPILSAGLTMTHAGARELACTILEIEQRQLPEKWLKQQYESRQSLRIGNHIKFADYWYTANSQLKELKEYTSQIAAESGLNLDPQEAWKWLAQGGFINEDLTIGIGGFSLDALKALGSFLTEVDAPSPFDAANVFKLDLTDATWSEHARYREGRVTKGASYSRAGKVLPVDGVFTLLLDVLQNAYEIDIIVKMIKGRLEQFKPNDALYNHYMITCLRGLEALVHDGWVIASRDGKKRCMDLRSEYGAIHKSTYGSKDPLDLKEVPTCL